MTKKARYTFGPKILQSFDGSHVKNAHHKEIYFSLQFFKKVTNFYSILHSK